MQFTIHNSIIGAILEVWPRWCPLHFPLHPPIMSSFPRLKWPPGRTALSTIIVHIVFLHRCSVILTAITIQQNPDSVARGDPIIFIGSVFSSRSGFYCQRMLFTTRRKENLIYPEAPEFVLVKRNLPVLISFCHGFLVKGKLFF